MLTIGGVYKVNGLQAYTICDASLASDNQNCRRWCLNVRMDFTVLERLGAAWGGEVEYKILFRGEIWYILIPEFLVKQKKKSLGLEWIC